MKNYSHMKRKTELERKNIKTESEYTVSGMKYNARKAKKLNQKPKTMHRNWK